LPDGREMLTDEKDRIPEGIQEPIGRAMLRINEAGKHDFHLVTFFDFCQSFRRDEELRQVIRPLVRMLDGLPHWDDVLNTINHVHFTQSDDIVDFRWARLNIFSMCLKKLIRTAGKPEVITVLPETEERCTRYLDKNPDLRETLEHFLTVGYPVLGRGDELAAFLAP